MSYHSSRLEEMCAAKRRQKIVKRHDIRQIRDFNRGSNAPQPLPVEEIVGADSQVEHVARLDAIGIVVVISWLGKGPYPPCGSVISLEVTVPLVPSGLVQFVIGLAAVAYVPLHAKPIDTS